MNPYIKPNDKAIIMLIAYAWASIKILAVALIALIFAPILAYFSVFFGVLRATYQSFQMLPDKVDKRWRDKFES